MTSLRSLRAAATVIATGVAVVLLAGPAAACPTCGNETEDGYGASVGVQVQVSGDVSASRRASTPLPPPACWWERLAGWNYDLDPTDPEAVEEYFYEEVRPYLVGHAGPGNLAFDTELFDRAIQAVESGEEVTWYRLVLSEDLRNDPEGQRRAAGLGCSRLVEAGPYASLISWNFFTGPPPPPVVDPEMLAQYAYEVMDLVAPTLDWNPKARQAANGSLVNLPTWLWVEDDSAVAQRSVTASAGGVSATVTAETGGLSVLSPAGATECDSQQAATRYAPGTTESAACTLTFVRASGGYANGFPVEASTVWNASWTASTGDGGDLNPRTENATTFIPVAEAQALVSRTN